MTVGLAILLLLAIFGFAKGKEPWADLRKLDLPKPVIALGALLSLFPVLKAVTPSDMLDWDTLAYHFAVPKIWIEQGSISTVPFIHHSYFPFAVDNLFLFGLAGGMEPAAKLVTAIFWVLGALWVFGITRRWAGVQSASIAALGFAASPLILWGSGSGYIDVAHGWLGALGAAYALEASLKQQGAKFGLAALGIGGALASKYTGLQMAFAVTVSVIVVMTVQRSWRSLAKPLIVSMIVAIALASPWYLRNAAETGNPVFPFFYEQLGGKGWDTWRASIYRNEQQTFGVGRTEQGRDLTAIGHAVLGLGYQPGRYINPLQDQGGGVPMGALGIALLVGPLGFIALARRSSVTRPFALGILGVSVLMLLPWFLLSQQARYMTALAPLWAMLLGFVLAEARESGLKKLLSGFAGLQAAVTVGVLYVLQAQQQLPVALGALDRQTAQQALVPFAEAAPAVNEAVTPQGKVALFDEVFGYFLNVPYVWANPGHSKIIPYEQLETGDSLAESLRTLGFSHVYLNLAFMPQDRRIAWWSAAGLIQDPVPMDRPETWRDDLNLKWQVLLHEALERGELRLIRRFPEPLPGGAQVAPRALLLEIAPRG